MERKRATIERKADMEVQEEAEMGGSKSKS